MCRGIKSTAACSMALGKWQPSPRAWLFASRLTYYIIGYRRLHTDVLEDRVCMTTGPFQRGWAVRLRLDCGICERGAVPKFHSHRGATQWQVDKPEAANGRTIIASAGQVAPAR